MSELTATPPVDAPVEAPVERYAIPQIAKTAMALLEAQFQRSVNDIGQQTRDALGLDASGEWDVDFRSGYVTRRVEPTPQET